MKHLLIASFLLLACYGYSQDYRCISDSGEKIFTNDDFFRVIHIDSTVETGTHTAYYLFHTLGSTDEYQECYNDQHPSWIGSAVHVFENGDHHFFNLEQDTIVIKTAASVGGEWTCYTFGNGDYIRATVTTIEYASFLGQSDSVKVIQFNVFDAGGNTVSHAVNGLKIKISKNWGLVQTLNFKLFPDLYDYPFYEYLNEYYLVGMHEPEVGIQNLTIGDIFDFDEGDEFHIHQYSVSWLQTNFHFYEIHRVLEKSWPSDTVVDYTMERCIRRHYYSNDTLILFQDTITLSINLLTFEDAGLNEVPDKALNYNDGWGDEYYWYSQHNHPEYNTIAKTFTGGFFYEEWMDCIMPLIDYDYSCYYLDRLGGPYWFYGSFGSESYRGLVYYKKGDETWGQPYDCDSLMVSIKNNGVALHDEIKIFPNPMDDFTHIEINADKHMNYAYRLINSMGTPVRKGRIENNVFILKREHLPGGLYFLQILRGNEVLQTQKLVIQ